MYIVQAMSRLFMKVQLISHVISVKLRWGCFWWFWARVIWHPGLSEGAKKQLAIVLQIQIKVQTNCSLFFGTRQDFGWSWSFKHYLGATMSAKKWHQPALRHQLLWFDSDERIKVLYLYWICTLSPIQSKKRPSVKHFYRTRVRSLFTLVTNWLTDWLTDWLLFSKLDWCDSGLWRCQLKTCWGFYCCWCWWWGSCWQQFVADLEAEVWL